MFSNIPINLLSETQLGRLFGFFIQRLVDEECGWREGLRLRSYACICICQSVQLCFLLYFSLAFAGRRTYVQPPLYLVFLCVYLCYIRCSPVKASLRADPLLNSGGNDGVCMYQQANRKRETSRKKGGRGSWGGARGVTVWEWKGEAAARRRSRREKTVVDLSTDFSSSQRKRPLSFDCELNHVRGTILKWHTEGGDTERKSKDHRLQLRPQIWDCGLEFLTFTSKFVPASFKWSSLKI